MKQRQDAWKFGVLVFHPASMRLGLAEVELSEVLAANVPEAALRAWHRSCLSFRALPQVPRLFAIEPLALRCRCLEELLRVLESQQQLQPKRVARRRLEVMAGTHQVE